VLEEAIHSLRGEPLVADIRNLGLAAAIDVTPLPGQGGMQAFRVFERALERGLYARFTGETLALAPPFISTPDEIRGAVEILRQALRAAA
jgi:beta-alanine--pyruvate transaminase